MEEAVFKTSHSSSVNDENHYNSSPIFQECLQDRMRLLLYVLRVLFYLLLLFLEFSRQYVLVISIFLVILFIKHS